MFSALIVVHDLSYGSLIQERLKDRGCLKLDLVQSMCEAWHHLALNKYDVVIVEAAAPPAALKFCKTLRQHDETVLVVLLVETQPAAADITFAFEAGANECLAINESIRLLIAKITALLRRRTSASAETLSVGSVVLDILRKQVSNQGRSKKLTNQEYKLLKCLFTFPNRAFSSAELASKLDMDRTSSDAVRQRVRILRRKLDWINAANILKTIPNIGYTVTPA